MDDALLVRRFERLGDLLRDRHRLVERNRAARDPLRQILALDQFHDERAARLPAFFESVDVRDVADGSAMRGLALRAEIGRGDRDRAAKASGRTLIATSRFSFVSRARYTSPMPPAPRRRRSRTGRGACRE